MHCHYAYYTIHMTKLNETQSHNQISVSAHRAALLLNQQNRSGIAIRTNVSSIMLQKSAMPYLPPPPLQLPRCDSVSRFTFLTVIQYRLTYPARY